MKSSVLRDVSCPTKMGLYDVSATLPDGARLGQRLVLDDGRCFHLAYAGGTALAAGYMCQAVAPVTNHTTMVCVAGAIGDTKITVTLGGTAVTANQYLWGQIHVDTSYGFGTSYKIAGHLAQATTTGNVDINIYDSLTTVLTTASRATLTRNPWDSTIVTPSSGLTAMLCGVPLVAVPINNYYWSQTWGLCPIYCVGTVIIGEPVGIGGTTAGACGPFGSGAAEISTPWGTVAHVTATTTAALIYLQLSI